MGRASGGSSPAQRANETNGRVKAGLPLSRGGRGERTVVVRRVRRAAAGRPWGCRGTRGAAELLQGWSGPDEPRGPGAAGSRPGPARGGRATPGELPGSEFAPQPKEGGSRRGPSKPPGNPGPESLGSSCFLGRPPGRPRCRVTVLGPRQKAPPGDPGGALRAAGADPGASSGEEGGFRRRRAGAEGPRPLGRGAGQRPGWRRTLGPSGAGVSATCPRHARPRSGLPGTLPRGTGPGRGDERLQHGGGQPRRAPAAPAAAAAPGYGQSCCLIEDGERCVRPAGNASFSKRVQKSISQKKLKLDIDKSVRHLYICDFHKNFIQSVRNKRKRKTSDDGGDSPEHDTDIPEVDLFQLQVNTLRRYKRHYKLQTRPGFNKAQLAETVSRHFRNIPVNEKETLAYFIYMVKSNKSRLDQKSEGGKQLE
uniref:Histone deacetylase complex subunit SAP30L n=5 Tax=Boreoeutheria TaxID=1437010 RepID=A0A2K5X6V3_MACFA